MLKPACPKPQTFSFIASEAPRPDAMESTDPSSSVPPLSESRVDSTSGANTSANTFWTVARNCVL